MIEIHNFLGEVGSGKLLTSREDGLQYSIFIDSVQDFMLLHVRMGQKRAKGIVF